MKIAHLLCVILSMTLMNQNSPIFQVSCLFGKVQPVGPAKKVCGAGVPSGEVVENPGPASRFSQGARLLVESSRAESQLSLGSAREGRGGERKGNLFYSRLRNLRAWWASMVGEHGRVVFTITNR